MKPHALVHVSTANSFWTVIICKQYADAGAEVNWMNLRSAGAGDVEGDGAGLGLLVSLPRPVNSCALRRRSRAFRHEKMSESKHFGFASAAGVGQSP